MRTAGQRKAEAAGRGVPVEELATVDSTELATPPVAGREAAVPLRMVYVAATSSLLGS